MIVDWLRNKKIPWENYRCFIDEEENCITFPVYDIHLYGRMVGRQEIKPFSDKKDRYNTWFSETSVWGLETIPENYNGIVFLTESIWRSIYLHRVNIPSVSLLGSSTGKKFHKELLNHRYDFVWIGDPDDSGEKLVDKFRTRGLTSPVDIDNMCDDDLKDFANYLRSVYNVGLCDQ